MWWDSDIQGGISRDIQRYRKVCDKKILIIDIVKKNWENFALRREAGFHWQLEKYIVVRQKIKTFKLTLKSVEG